MANNFCLHSSGESAFRLFFHIFLGFSNLKHFFFQFSEILSLGKRVWHSLLFSLLHWGIILFNKEKVERQSCEGYLCSNIGKAAFCFSYLHFHLFLHWFLPLILNYLASYSYYMPLWCTCYWYSLMHQILR